ncbi:hypothetical protein U1Q18_003218, partial [Sarracenia purpurea var. burkii]
GTKNLIPGLPWRTENLTPRAADIHLPLKAVEAAHCGLEIAVNLRPNKRREDRGQMESSWEHKDGGEQEIVVEIRQ